MLVIFQLCSVNLENSTIAADEFCCYVVWIHESHVVIALLCACVFVGIADLCCSCQVLSQAMCNVVLCVLLSPGSRL